MLPLIDHASPSGNPAAPTNDTGINPPAFLDLADSVRCFPTHRQHLTQPIRRRGLIPIFLTLMLCVPPRVFRLYSDPRLNVTYPAY